MAPTSPGVRRYRRTMETTSCTRTSRRGSTACMSGPPLRPGLPPSHQVLGQEPLQRPPGNPPGGADLDERQPAGLHLLVQEGPPQAREPHRFLDGEAAVLQQLQVAFHKNHLLKSACMLADGCRRMLTSA